MIIKLSTYSEDRTLVVVNVFTPLPGLLLFILLKITTLLILSRVFCEFLISNLRKATWQRLKFVLLHFSRATGQTLGQFFGLAMLTLAMMALTSATMLTHLRALSANFASLASFTDLRLLALV